MAAQTLNDFIESIYDSVEGPETVAFFDFDKTLIDGYSAKSFLIEQIRSGGLTPRDMRKQLSAIAKFSSGRIDRKSVV